MFGAVRLSGKTTHDDVVLEGSSGVTFMELPVSCMPDRVFCPVHGETIIVEGDFGSGINGKPAALHGHRCGCGYTLISPLPVAEGL